MVIRDDRKIEVHPGTELVYTSSMKYYLQVNILGEPVIHEFDDIWAREKYIADLRECGVTKDDEVINYIRLTPPIAFDDTELI